MFHEVHFDRTTVEDVDEAMKNVKLAIVLWICVRNAFVMFNEKSQPYL